MRTKNAVLRPTDTLDIAPADAERLGFSEAERVRVRSRYGEAVLPIHLCETVKAGELFGTFHTAAAFLNHVTSAQRDSYVGAPEYKVTAVQIERIAQ